MRIREPLCSVTIAVLLAIALVAWPAPSAEAGQADPEAKSSPLVLRLYGGLSRVEAGDINEGLDGYFEIFELYRAWGFGTTTGGYTPLRDGYNAGADLVLQISRGIGIGIGAGYLHVTESSLLTFSLGAENYKVSGAPTLTAVPIRLGLFFTVPLGKRLNLTADVGADAYAALKLDAPSRIDYPDGEAGEQTLSASGGSPFDYLGFHGSLGFEFLVSRNTGIFVEALGRYARLKNFERATRSSKTSGSSEVTEGGLYLATYTATDGQHWSAFTVEETPPVSGTPSIVYSEPKVDLSGFSLQAGLRIRL